MCTDSHMSTCVGMNESASSQQGKSTKHHVGAVTCTPVHPCNSMTGVNDSHWDMTLQLLSDLGTRVRSMSHVVKSPIRRDFDYSENTVARCKQRHGV